MVIWRRDSVFSAKLRARSCRWCLGVSAVIGAYWRAQVSTGQLTLELLKWPAAAYAVILLLIFFLPLALFTPALLREKRLSIRKYGFDPTSCLPAVPSQVDDSAQSTRRGPARCTRRQLARRPVGGVQERRADDHISIPEEQCRGVPAGPRRADDSSRHHTNPVEGDHERSVRSHSLTDRM